MSFVDFYIYICQYVILIYREHFQIVVVSNIHPRMGISEEEMLVSKFVFYLASIMCFSFKWKNMNFFSARICHLNIMTNF
jgi:hypothetical protein